MQAASTQAGGRIPDPAPRPWRALLRFTGQAGLLACWLVIVLMAILTWGPRLSPVRTDIIIGQSMEPTIPLYSVIVVDPIDPDNIRVGDVITYQEPDRPERKVTHRVAEIVTNSRGGPTFLTKGDNNDVRDPYEVTYADEGYRVRTHVPHVGWLMIQAQTALARVLFVVVPVLVLLVQFLRWLWRDEQESLVAEQIGWAEVEAHDDELDPFDRFVNDVLERQPDQREVA
ncbi:MAG: signal peptidase I [Gaiellales bacterium]